MLAQPPAVRRWVLFAYWAWIFALTHWPGLDDLVDIPDWLPHSDKLVHFSLYAGWICVWWWLLSAHSRVSAPTMGWLLAGGAAYGLFDEVTQVIVGRDFEIADWCADLGGMAAALLLLMFLQSRGSTRRF